MGFGNLSESFGGSFSGVVKRFSRMKGKFGLGVKKFTQMHSVHKVCMLSGVTGSCERVPKYTDNLFRAKGIVLIAFQALVPGLQYD